jgi:hypothetical protein
MRTTKKGSKQIDQLRHLDVQTERLGFKGDFRQWEHLLRIHERGSARHK